MNTNSAFSGYSVLDWAERVTVSKYFPVSNIVYAHMYVDNSMNKLLPFFLNLSNNTITKQTVGGVVPFTSGSKSYTWNDNRMLMVDRGTKNFDLYEFTDSSSGVSMTKIGNTGTAISNI
jgi:hypothetical protein